MKRNKLALLFLLFLVHSPWSIVHSQSPASLYRILIDGYIIHPITAEYIEKTIDRAEKEKAQAVLIVMDTPGGLLESTRGIVKKIMNAPLPVIVYVAPAGSRAASAGVFITMAAHVAAMAPTTHIGAAHPVELGEGGQKNPFEGLTKKEEEKPESKTHDAQRTTHNEERTTHDAERTTNSPMIDKIMHDTLAWVENIAQARGRNVAWAKKAVQESDSITAEEALKLNVIDLMADNEKELLEKLNGRVVKVDKKEITLRTKEAPIETITLNWRQSLLNVLINPNIAYILLTLGFYGLLFEITHPGSWAPGVAGLISILLAFYSFHIIPTDYAGIILTIVGLFLLGAELFVTSGGLLALGGFVCLFFGAVFLIDQPQEFLRLSLRVAIPTLGASAAIFGLLTAIVIRSHRRKVVTGEEGLVGEIGVADTDLNPAGKVFVQGEIWDATSEEPIRKGEKVKILGLENFKLSIKKLKPDD